MDPRTYPYRDAIREEHTATMYALWLKENTESFGPLVPEKLTNVTFVFLEAIEKHLLKVPLPQFHKTLNISPVLGL